MLPSSFISGLKPELKLMVRLLKPHTVNQAFEQTLLQEQSFIEMAKTQHFPGKHQFYGDSGVRQHWPEILLKLSV